jgi:predicted acylesterase/phospholipase RssA
VSQPLNIQLAIQGGGAKICALMAAIEALEELQGKEINVTRIAGTSAGSIVGCLFAAGVPMKDLKKLLVGGGLGDELVKLFKTPRYVKLALQAYRGQPLWETLVVQQKLETLFKEQGVHFLKDLKSKKGIEVIVIAADLRDGQMVQSSQETSIVGAIMDSCGLPYCFRTWKQGVGGGAVIVDGGICENLPVDVLKQEADKYGPVAALSFFPTPRPTPSTVTSFSMALLDTAMNNAVNRAKALLPPDHVFEIETSVTTFDFPKALKDGLGEEYWRINKQAEEFFEEFVKLQRKLLHHVAEDPWNEPNATLKELMQNLGRIYERQHDPIKFKYLKCDFVVDANCLLEEGEPFYGSPDGLFYELTFQPAVEPLYGVSVGLSQHRGIKHLGKTSFKLFDAHYNELPVEHVPIFNPKEPASREVLLFFTPPLLPGSGPYILRLRDQALNLMGPLREKKADELAYFPRRSVDSIDQINLVMHVPERLRNSISVVPPSNGLGRRMTDPELANYRPPGGFTSFGWTGQNITKPSDGIFKVDFRLA